LCVCACVRVGGAVDERGVYVMNTEMKHGCCLNNSTSEYLVRLLLPGFKH
jgi:hypothetical protein